jgi:hypothetical protein
VIRASRQALGLFLLVIALLFATPGKWLVSDRRVRGERRGASPRAVQAPTSHDLLRVERAAERRRRKAQKRAADHGWGYPS